MLPEPDEFPLSTGNKFSRKGLSTILTEKTTIIPPDGGWGWMVVIGSFFCNFVVDGVICTLYGKLLNEIAESFKTQPTTVATGSSLLFGFYFVSGPLTYGMIRQCGFKIVGFTGGTIAAFAFLAGPLTASSSSSSFYGFIIIIGVFGGTGLGMVYITAVVVVGYYFERWRALTTSIALTGSAVGIMLIPLILDLVDECEWRTAFKSVTGLCFLCTFLALVYRPLPLVRVLTRDGVIVRVLSDDDDDTNEPSTSGAENESKKKTIFKRCWKGCIQCTNFEVKPMHRNEFFFSSILLTKKQSRSNRPSRISRNPETVADDVFEEQDQRHCCVPIRKTLCKMLNFNLLKSPTFLLLAFSGCASFMGLYIPFVYVHERANETGISKKYSHYFYTVLGLSNAIGRIISGIVTVIPQTEALMISYISITISGIASVASFFLKDIYSQFVYNSIFGLTTACVPCLRTTIVADLFGLENMTNGFGLLMLFNGLGSLLATPLANLLIQFRKSYDIAFMYAGCVLILSAIMLMPLNQISDWEYERKERRELQED